jgi:hypothetical protein
MYVIKSKHSDQYLCIQGRKYKFASIDGCSTYLSERGAQQALNKHKTHFYLGDALKVKPEDFEVREVKVTLL